MNLRVGVAVHKVDTMEVADAVVAVVLVQFAEADIH